VEHAIPLSEALVRRLYGLLAGPISCAIAGLLGWPLGGLLPEPRS
jgi:hypothetical protein